MNSNSMEEALMWISENWDSLKLRELTYFFLHKNKYRKRYLGFSLRHIPNFTYNIENFPSIVRLQMYWCGSKQFKKASKKTGWDAVETKIEIVNKYKTKNSYNNTFQSKMIVDLHKINKISSYLWGFEISTEGPVDLVAVSDKYLDDDYLDSMFNNKIDKCWEIPFKGLYEDNLRFSTFHLPSFSWSQSDNMADISDLLGETERDNIHLVDMGQRLFDIDMEEE